MIIINSLTVFLHKSSYFLTSMNDDKFAIEKWQQLLQQVENIEG
jgi:hypothetical protein